VLTVKKTPTKKILSVATARRIITNVARLSAAEMKLYCGVMAQGGEGQYPLSFSLAGFFGIRSSENTKSGAGSPPFCENLWVKL